MTADALRLLIEIRQWYVLPDGYCEIHREMRRFSTKKKKKRRKVDKPDQKPTCHWSFTLL